MILTFVSQASYIPSYLLGLGLNRNVAIPRYYHYGAKDDVDEYESIEIGSQETIKMDTEIDTEIDIDIDDSVPNLEWSGEDLVDPLYLFPAPEARDVPR
jgi:hypothetical protein